MLYPKNHIETKISFDKIRKLVRECCSGSIGRALVNKMAFLTDYETINLLTKQTEEFCQVLMQSLPFPESNYLDVSKHLNKSLIRNSFLSEAEFYELKRSLSTIYDCLQFFNKHKDEFPLLYQLSEHIRLPFDVIQEIDKVIDQDGKLKNNASAELQRIRQDIIRTQVLLRKKMDGLLKEYRQKGWIKEDAEVTIRDGRMVLPVKAEYKRQIKGIVHHASATGQTVYIEPTVILSMNNEIKELEFQEKREIIRILTFLTDQIRPHVESLTQAYHFLAEIDFIRAKARFALQIDAINPNFEKKTRLHWDAAYHPLLLLAHNEQGKTTVPHSIYLDNQERILLISGPNAGGKSVCLKTVGLLQYMYQCGLLIPVAEGSTVGLFDDIFIDIGDEQSIDNDLSTYSSHLTNMRFFLKYAGKKSLCLIDEFGTGTEPQFGGAIAEAILEQLNTQGCFAVITTHYANLKLFAEKTAGIINGAMRFDVENLEPLFHLQIGQPGSSFALEIGQKIGLPQSILAAARNKIGSSQIDIERLIKDLEKEKTMFRQMNQKVKQQESALQKDMDTYQFLKNQINLNKKQILNKAKQEAADILSTANQKIEHTIKQIKENKAEKEKTKQLRQQLDVFKEETKPEKLPPPQLLNPKKKGKQTVVEVLGGEIIAGDTVRIKGSHTIGEVISINNKEARLSIGDLKTTIKMNRLEKVAKTNNSSKQKHKSHNTIDFMARQSRFSPEIDIRGKRAEACMSIVEEFIDSAIMLSQYHLRIVHGKGNGVLRQVVRDTLRQYKEITHFGDEHADRGGSGVTLIQLDSIVKEENE